MEKETKNKVSEHPANRFLYLPPKTDSEIQVSLSFCEFIAVHPARESGI